LARSWGIIALWAGLKVVEVPSFEAERIYGEGRLQTFPDGWRVLKTIIRERLQARAIDEGGGPAAERCEQSTGERS
jgi:hypothetical protein